ncbi:Uncharacterised protein [Segatella buccae]|jgi:hypothetical protein|uniref:Uncharacterized protein n=1 Tax=Segatella buccae TaxID=28126 RepID=A0AAQ1UFZ2_9BACT|nr:Uncharacterised protein [Segatella buccae]
MAERYSGKKIGKVEKHQQVYNENAATIESM